jgi:hypothetical protein
MWSGWYTKNIHIGKMYTKLCKMAWGIVCDQVEVAQTNFKGVVDQKQSVGELMTHPVYVNVDHILTNCSRYMCYFITFQFR